VSVNPVRPAPCCAVYDDHPRHVTLDATGAETALHMDCCALRGCTVCLHQLAGVQPGTIGDDLREHLLTLPPVLVEHVPNDDPGDPLNLTTAVVTPLEV
jgi:hypothetical protein